MEKAMAPHSSTLAWKIPWTEEPSRLQSMGSLSRTGLSDFTFTFHLHALEREMATHSSVLAWRIPGTGEPGGLPSMGSHRVGHDWSNLAAAAAAAAVYSETISKNGRGIELWDGIGQMALAYLSCLPSNRCWWLLGLRAWALEKEFWSNSLQEIISLLCVFSLLSHKMWVRKVPISQDEVNGMCNTFRRAPCLFLELHRCQLFSLFHAWPPYSLRKPPGSKPSVSSSPFLSKVPCPEEGLCNFSLDKREKEGERPFSHHPSTQIAHSWATHLQNKQTNKQKKTPRLLKNSL